MCPFQPLISITGSNKAHLFLTSPRGYSLFLRLCFSLTSLLGMIANSSYRLSSQLKSETTFSKKPEKMFWAQTGLLWEIRTFWGLFFPWSILTGIQIFMQVRSLLPTIAGSFLWESEFSLGTHKFV
jgi:hypothetical protein